METELLTVIENLGLLRICGVRIAQSFVFCEWFCNSLFVFFFPFFVCLFCCLFSDLRLLITSLVSSNFSYPCFVGRDLCCSLYQFSVLTTCELCCRCGWICFNSFTLVLSYSIYRLGIYVSYSFQTLNAIRWQPLISPWDMVKHLMGDDTESNMSSNVLCKENLIPQWCM